MTSFSNESIIRELTQNLRTGNAHVSLEDALANMKPELRSKLYENLPYSLWQLAEHIRIAQWDILEFSTSPDHQSPQWPDEYWPEPVDEVSDEIWEKTLEAIRTDRERFIQLLNDRQDSLFQPFPYGDGQTLFKEALLIIDHTSYHVGEILVLRRLFKDWN